MTAAEAQAEVVAAETEAEAMVAEAEAQQRGRWKAAETEAEATTVATVATREEGRGGWMEVSCRVHISPEFAANTSCSEPTSDAKACGDLTRKATRT